MSTCSCKLRYDPACPLHVVGWPDPIAAERDRLAAALQEIAVAVPNRRIDNSREDAYMALVERLQTIAVHAVAAIRENEND